MPVPAPGTAAILVGLSAYGSDIPAELTTPTGAAILATLAGGHGPMPAMTVERVAYGAGQREVAADRSVPSVVKRMVPSRSVRKISAPAEASASRVEGAGWP